MKKILCIVFVLLVISGCSFKHVEDVKQRAVATWEANGFQVVGYQGYALGQVIPFTKYGGACVWYRLKNIPDNGIVYQGCLQRWGNEYHVYSLKAIDAIKPQSRR